MAHTGGDKRRLHEILASWNFPASIVDKYRSLGIEEIFEWQAECLRIQRVLDGGNLVYSAPTSAGKTLVAELLMLKNVLETKRKALFILPYVSLAKEKLKHLQWLLADYHTRADGFIGSSSPHGGFAQVDIAICTIEKANSLLNRLIEEEQIFELGAVVVDELHMIGDASRGYLLELILSKIKFIGARVLSNSPIQIIGMSATLPSLDRVADWLDASLYQTDFRPIELAECLKFEDKIYDRRMEVVEHVRPDPRIENDPEQVVQLVLETMTQRLGVLVFCPTKARCETLAENIARVIYNLEKHHSESLAFLNKEKIIDALNELKTTPAGLDSQLARCVRYGIAFHHAGLTTEERDVLEKHFKQNTLLVIVCTSTLSSGINFPARRVIIRTPIFNGRPIDVMSYKQMIGRAGRKGIDTRGESFLMCANANEKKAGQALMNAAMPSLFEEKPKSSKPATDELEGSVKRALLETIVSGVATRRSDVVAYSRCFLSAKRGHEDPEVYLRWLQKNEFISIVQSQLDGESDSGEGVQQQVECYKPSQLGFAVVAAAMSPDEGLVIFGELQRALQCFVLENELHIVYQITPINICDYWTSSTAGIDWNLYYTILQNLAPDYKRVADLVGIRQSFVLKMIKGASASSCDPRLLKVHLRFFTALILNDLVNEHSFAALLAKYSCQKGFLQTLQQSAATYACMVTTFCNRLGWFNLELLVSQFQSRLLFGVQRQLLDLVRIRLLNSHRARLFYNAGFTTVASVAMCDLKKLEKLLRSSIAFVSSRPQQQQQEEAQDSNSSEAVIWCEGKKYTYWEASVEIFQEANDLLRKDLEQMGVKYTVEKKVEADKNVERTVIELNETYDSLMVTLNKTTRRSVNPPALAEEDESEEKASGVQNPAPPSVAVSVPAAVERTPTPKRMQKPATLTPMPATTPKSSNLKVSELFADEQETAVRSQREDEEDTGTSLVPASQAQISVSQANSFLDNQALLKIVDQMNQELTLKKPDKEATPKRKEPDPVPAAAEPSPAETSGTTSFIEDLAILQVARQFETDSAKKAAVPKPLPDAARTPKAAAKVGLVFRSNQNLMNTTVVSDDILQMCDKFEKNSILSAKKEPTTSSFSASKENTAASRQQQQQQPVSAIRKECRRDILANSQFKVRNSLDEHTFKSILNSSAAKPTEPPPVEPKKEKEPPPPIRTSSSSSGDVKVKIMRNLGKYLAMSRVNLRIVESQADYESFYASIKSRSTLSLSLACQVFQQSKASETPTSGHFEWFDADTNSLVKIYGLFVCFITEKDKQASLFISSNSAGSSLFQSYTKRLLEREDLIKLMFFAKEHAKLLAGALNANVKMPCYDPIIANWLLCQERSSIYQIQQKFSLNFSIPIEGGLKTSKRCYGCTLTSAESLKSQNSELDLLRNAFVECMIGAHSFEKLKSRLQLENLWVYFAKIESEIVLLTSQMEFVGLGLNLDELEHQKCVLIKKKKELEERINTLAGKTVQLTSPEQVASLIYDQLKLKPSADDRISDLAKYKHHKTSKDALQHLVGQHELPKMIILWRKINHALTHCIFPIERAKCFHKTIKMFRLHSSIDLFNVTGRMSFNEPSLQSIPRDFDIAADQASGVFDVNGLDELRSSIMGKEEMLEEHVKMSFFDKLDEDSTDVKTGAPGLGTISIRNSFIPYEDRVILAVDYCQLELRIITNMCKDETLIGVFNDSKHDLFKLLASKWLNLPIAEIDDEKRSNVKKIIYGIIYGISPKTLSTLLNLEESEAAAFIDSFKSTFPGLKKFISTQIEECKRLGYVETIRQRKRNIPNIFNADIKLRSQAERQAINTIVQGSASDLVKTAMVKIEKTIRKTYSSLNKGFSNDYDLFRAEKTSSPRGAFLVLQMHDELIYEVNKQDLNDIKLIVKDCMENCMEFQVQMKVKLKIGKSWGSLTEIKDV